MTVVLKPIGRGRWKPMTLSYEGTRALPLLIRVGERVTLGGVTWRVCKVFS